MTWNVGIIETGTLPQTPLANYVVGPLDEVLLDLPCYSWLLRDGRTAVLVDTGPNTSPSEDVGYAVAGDAPAALRAALKRHDLEPADVNMVIHTHLHQDHIENDWLFPNAQVLVQRGELEGALRAESACARLSPATRAALAAGPYAASQEAGLWYAGVANFARETGDRLHVIDGEQEILPGLTVMPNGGHTRGHQSVVVSTAEGAVCVCGDIVSLALNRDVLGPVTPDTDATCAFLRRVHASAWEALPSHDPVLRSHRWYIATG